MDIALDANILIRDPWLRSQDLRILLDHVQRSKDRILLSEVVRIEVKAHFERKLSDRIRKIRSACKSASRIGVIGIPDFSPDVVLEETVAQWDARFHEVLNEGVVTHIPIPSDLLPEVVERAAERRPPCSASGTGIRDAVIWLSLLEYSCSQSSMKKFAFISAKTEDFANEGTLAEELLRDAESYGIEVLYYPSLSDFLSQYAEPVSHIDLDWLRTRVDMQAAKEMIQAYMDRWGFADRYEVCDPRYRERFLPIGEPSLSALDTDIDDFQLWEFDDQHMEVRLTFAVRVEGRSICARNPQPRLFYEYEDIEPELETCELRVSAQFAIDVSAQVTDDTVEFLQVEDVRRA